MLKGGSLLVFGRCGEELDMADSYMLHMASSFVAIENSDITSANMLKKPGLKSLTTYLLRIGGVTSKDDLDNLVDVIDSCYKFTKFGSYVLYLTCSITVSEIKAVIDYTLKKRDVIVQQPQQGFQVNMISSLVAASRTYHHQMGLLQYFNLVEGCLTMIEAHQAQHNFTYDWIVRTRVDGYWNAPLGAEYFIKSHYLVPPGSTYGGLNDRLGIGDYNSSAVALSRLSMIPELDSAGFRQLNSETSFKAQLTTRRVPFLTMRLPFCIVSDRKYDFPPKRFGVPVAAMSSPGPLSGAKCRPCRPVCVGPCVGPVMETLYAGWSWTDWQNGTLGLCDARGGWESGWEKEFDRVAGKKRASARKRVGRLKVEKCVKDFEEMKGKSSEWDTPPVGEICRLGLGGE